MAAKILLIPTVCLAASIPYKTQVDLPTLSGTADEQGRKTITIQPNTKSIGEYIKAIYEYAIGIVGILATVVMMMGGFLWLTAGGSAERIGNAKSWIGASLTGLVLVLASYTILSYVNTDLVNFKGTEITSVDDGTVEGCCLLRFEGTEKISIDTNRSNCLTNKGTFYPNQVAYNEKTTCEPVSSAQTCCTISVSTGGASGARLYYCKENIMFSQCTASNATEIMNRTPTELDLNTMQIETKIDSSCAPLPSTPMGSGSACQ